MVRLVITEEQSRILEAAGSVVEVADASGRLVGRLYPAADDDEFTPEEIARIKEAARNSTRWFTTSDVLEHLERLAPSDPRP